MIWLASFPRSGNTFFRNILFEVYGIASSEYHEEPNMPVNPDFMSFPVVKTHLLPSQLPEEYKHAKSVYIVRDGRDAVVSMAHHRKDIVAPGSNYYRNLMDAILARKGSFFGGWSENVKQWTEKADVIIKFEDLIQDPLNEIERLRSILVMPEADESKVPNFSQLRNSIPKYGPNVANIDNQSEKLHRSKLFFRRGKAGAYKDEMPLVFRILFWLKHREQMRLMHYYK